MGLMRRAWVPVLLLAMLVAAVLVVPYRAVELQLASGEAVRLPNPAALTPTSDVWDYLQLGRRLAEGHGYTSNFTYVPFLPESAAHLHETGAFPLLWRQPGFPTLVAGSFRLAGDANPNAYLWLFALTVIALPLATYRLAQAVLPMRWCALAACWALLSPVTVGLADPLVATPLLAAWSALLFAVAFRHTAWGGAMLLGVLAGLGVLLRQEVWLLVPALMVLLVGLRTTGRATALFLAAAAGLVCLVPWLWRTALVTGHPLFNATSLLYHDTAAFPGWEASRTLAVRDTTPLRFLATYPVDVLEKCGLGLLRYARDLVLSAGVLLPFAVVSAFRPPQGTVPRLFVRGVWVAGLVLVLVLVPFEHNARFLAPLLPLLAVLAALTVARLPRPAVWAAGISLVVALGFVGQLGSRNLPEADSAQRALQDLDALLAAEGGRAPFTVVLTDAPTLYAWAWDRPAVWAPVARDVERVRALIPVEWALLTCGAPRYLGPGLAGAYAAHGARLAETGCSTRLAWPVAETP